MDVSHSIDTLAPFGLTGINAGRVVNPSFCVLYNVRRLIYNFSRGGHLHAEKTRKLIFRPIAKG